MQAIRTTILMSAALGLGLAAPAHARVIRVLRPHPLLHPYRHPGWTPIRYDRVHGDINDLAKAIGKAEKDGSISEQEAANLRSRVDELRSQLKSYDSNGLTHAEVMQLEGRINYVRRPLGMEQLDYDNQPG